MATNKQRRAEKALQQQQENDPDFVAPAQETDSSKLVEAAIKNIKKGSGFTFNRMKDRSKELRPVIPTGIFALDHKVLGSGGMPRGRIVEIYGAPSGGKGTITAQIVASAQRIYSPNEISYTDAECALDYTYAEHLGVDTDNLLVGEPEYGEQALQATLDIISTGGIKLAVVDSVAALVPKAELDGEMSDAHVGLQARMMGQALRKFTGIVSKTGTCLIFINQVRATVGTSFGPKSDTPGGKALKFYSSVRLSVDRLQQYKEKDDVVGSVVKIKAQKNKTAVPFKEHDFNLLFDQPGQKPGFDSMMSLVDEAIEHKIWVQSGKTYTLASTGEIVSGRVNLRDALRDNKETRRITEEATLMAMGKSPEYIKRALGA